MKLKIRIDNIFLLLYLVPLLAFPYYANSTYKWINALSTFIFFLYECRAYFIHGAARKALRKNGYVLWLLLATIFVTIASFWSGNLRASLNKALIMWMAIVGQIAIILWVQNEASRLKKIIDVSLIITVIVFFRVILITPFSAYGYQNLFSEITGFDKNAFAMLGAFLSISAFYLFYCSKKKAYLLLWCIMFAMAIVGASRKGALIAVVAVPMIVFFKNGSVKKVLYVILFILLFIAGVYLVMTNSYLYELVGERLYALYLSVIGKNTSDGSLIERELMRNMAMELFDRKKILGWGTDGFAIQCQGYLGKYVYSHCNYTEMLCNFGLIGFCIYYFYPFIFTVNTLKGVLKHNISYIYAFTVFIIFIVFEYGFVSYYAPVYYLMKTLAVLAFVCEKTGENIYESERKNQTVNSGYNIS